MAAVVLELCAASGDTIAVAESCTGGLLGARLTEIPGSSRVLLGGVIAYSNAVKEQELGVSADDLEQFGAVSEQVAVQMARGVRGMIGATIGVGITGIAGPDGGSEKKPVGTVFLAVSSPLGEAVRVHRFMGGRATVRGRAAQTALDMLRRHLAELPVDPTLE